MTDEEASELAEKIADRWGIYGSPPDKINGEVWHPEDCKCRICFVLETTEELLSEQKELFDDLERYVYEARKIWT